MLKSCTIPGKSLDLSELVSLFIESGEGPAYIMNGK